MAWFVFRFVFPQERVFNNFPASFFGSFRFVFGGQLCVISNFPASFFKKISFMSYNCNAKLSRPLFSTDCSLIKSPSRLPKLMAASRIRHQKDYRTSRPKSSQFSAEYEGTSPEAGRKNGRAAPSTTRVLFCASRSITGNALPQHMPGYLGAGPSVTWTRSPGLIHLAKAFWTSGAVILT